MSERIYYQGLWGLIVDSIARPGGPMLSITVDAGGDVAELSNDDVRALRRALDRWLRSVDRRQKLAAAERVKGGSR